jgi:acetyltransferase-like isoleucine patch superfamily enzyme
VNLALPLKILRRHSATWNAVRNLGWLLRGVFVAHGGSLIVEGQFVHGCRLRIGNGARVIVPKADSLRFGDDCWIASHVEMNAGGVMQFGDRVTVQRNTTLNGNISVGAGCLFAPNVFASSGEHQFRLVPWITIRDQELLAEQQNAGQNRSARIDIGEDCWIGTNSVILAGVTLGRGAIVGAGAIVRRDVEPYEIVAGAPARRIATRFEFRPPVKVEVAAEMQIPYLYSGFQQWRAGRERSLALQGGVLADRDFSLALDTAAARQIWIDTRCSRSGATVKLRHGLAERSVPDNWSIVRFPIAAPGWCIRLSCTEEPYGARWPLLIRAFGVE